MTSWLLFATTRTTVPWLFCQSHYSTSKRDNDPIRHVSTFHLPVTIYFRATISSLLGTSRNRHGVNNLSSISQNMVAQAQHTLSEELSSSVLFMLSLVNLWSSGLPMSLTWLWIMVEPKHTFLSAFFTFFRELLLGVTSFASCVVLVLLRFATRNLSILMVGRTWMV